MDGGGTKVSARPRLVLTCYIYKFRNNFQDPTRDLSEPKVELVCWCSYFKLGALQFCTKKCEIVPNRSASLELHIYIAHISHVPLKAPKTPNKLVEKIQEKLFCIIN